MQAGRKYRHEKMIDADFLCVSCSESTARGIWISRHFAHPYHDGIDTIPYKPSDPWTEVQSCAEGWDAGQELPAKRKLKSA